MRKYRSLLKRYLVLMLALTLLFGALPGAFMFAAGENLLNQPSPDWGGSNGFTDSACFDMFAADSFKSDDFIPGEVLAPADSWEEAQEIAAVYGLELKSYAWGIAVLAAADPQQVVAQSNLLSNSIASLTGRVIVPKLSLNSIGSFDEIDYTYDNIHTTSAPDSSTQWHHLEMDCERAWVLSKGEGVTVAVIDSGIDISHPEFAGRIRGNSYNSQIDQIGLEYVQDYYGHGTHVSGIVAAAGIEVSGVAPKAEIMAIKLTLADSEFFSADSLLRAINYAAENGADIINMSLGNTWDELGDAVLSNAVAKGVTVVCAAGNSNSSQLRYPGSHPEAITVSSLKEGGIFDSSYSNYGPGIDLAAPGTAVNSTKTGGGYMKMSGTSMASPNVAGVAALIKSFHPEYSPQQVRDLMCRTARQGGFLGKDNHYGWGAVSAYGSLLGPDALLDITYNFNGGEPAPVKIKAAPGSKLIVPYWPIRDGYAFDNWYLFADSGDAFDFTAAVNEEMTLYAQWIKAVPGMYAGEFPDAIFRREVLRLLNSWDDGCRGESDILSEDDIAMLSSFTQLLFNKRGIRDLTGIGWFSGLSRLDCSEDLLLELDLSKNTALTHLACVNSQLEKINISKNTILEDFICYNNQLMELDVSQNNLLRTLNCNGNQLIKLDLPNSFWLSELFCSGNRLTELDVSKNIALRFLDCSDNYLLKLDVSRNTAVANLYCSDNQLTELDIDKNPALAYLTCWNNRLTELDIAKNLALRSLCCQSNQLRELDLSKNNNLETLVCGDNQFTELNISLNTNLSSFQCENNQLRELDLSHNPRLGVFMCQGNQLRELDVTNNPYIMRFECGNNQLTELDLSNN
ncbi:MAG: S8 family serine peptidase, partial [Clostridiales bacterium]|nr:S8 family serine peptidase [Clostridiales bacterium]